MTRTERLGPLCDALADLLEEPEYVDMALEEAAAVLFAAIAARVTGPDVRPGMTALTRLWLTIVKSAEADAKEYGTTPHQKGAN